MSDSSMPANGPGPMQKSSTILSPASGPIPPLNLPRAVAPCTRFAETVRGPSRTTTSRALRRHVCRGGGAAARLSCAGGRSAAGGGGLLLRDVGAEGGDQGPQPVGERGAGRRHRHEQADVGDAGGDELGHRRPSPRRRRPCRARPASARPTRRHRCSAGSRPRAATPSRIRGIEAARSAGRRPTGSTRRRSGPAGRDPLVERPADPDRHAAGRRPASASCGSRRSASSSDS